jgi:hypothetical protein
MFNTDAIFLSVFHLQVSEAADVKSLNTESQLSLPKMVAVPPTIM